jgi:hypothetical protein
MSDSEIQEIVAIAHQILDGSLDLLRGCSFMANAMLCADLEMDPDCRIFERACGDSNHLPLGPDRQYWNAEVLKRKDEEIAAVTAKHRDEVLSACYRLIDGFGTM